MPTPLHWRGTPAERFARRCSEPSERGCIIWTGSTNGHYGTLYVGGGQVLVHRFAWQHLRGEIPAGLFVLHRCDTPLCVNPEHLFLGTQADNMRDMATKGRRRLSGFAARAAAKTHCPQGHPYDEENTMISRGARYCRTCCRARVRAYRERKAVAS